MPFPQLLQVLGAFCQFPAYRYNLHVGLAKSYRRGLDVVHNKLGMVPDICFSFFRLILQLRFSATHSIPVEKLTAEIAIIG